MTTENHEVIFAILNAGFAEEAIFAYAFRLGARIIAEALLPPIGEDCE